MIRRAFLCSLTALASCLGAEARMMHGGVVGGPLSASSLTINEFAVGYFGAYFTWSNFTVTGNTTVTDASSTGQFDSRVLAGNTSCIGKPLTIGGVTRCIVSCPSVNQVVVEAPGFSNGTGLAGSLSFPGIVINRAAGSNSRNITVSGTYAGNTPSSFDVQLTFAADCKIATPGAVFKAWTQLSSFTASGGTWSGQINVPLCNDWVVAQARDHYTTSVKSDLQGNYWGVGVIIWFAGQSNVTRLFTSGSYSVAQDPRTKCYDRSGWHSLYFQSGMPSYAGQTADENVTRMMNEVTSALNCVSGVIQQNYSGAAIKQWLLAANGGYPDNDPNNFWSTVGGGGFAYFGAAGGGTSSSDLAGMNSSTLLYGKDFEIALWQQGEAEAMAGNSTAAYITWLESLRNQLLSVNSRANTQFNMCVVPLGSLIGGVDTAWNDIRTAHLTWLTTNAATGGIFGGSVLDATHDYTEMALAGDAIHWCFSDYTEIGKRYTQALLKAVGAQAQGAEGPKCASAVWTAGNNYFDVTVTQATGTALKDQAGSTSGTGALGFTALLNGSPATITGWAITGATTIRVTTSSTKTGGQTASFQYLYGANPLNATGTSTPLGMIYDNVTYGALYPSSRGFPLQPTNGTIAIPP